MLKKINLCCNLVILQMIIPIIITLIIQPQMHKKFSYKHNKSGKKHNKISQNSSIKYRTKLKSEKQLAFKGEINCVLMNMGFIWLNNNICLLTICLCCWCNVIIYLTSPGKVWFVFTSAAQHVYRQTLSATEQQHWDTLKLDAFECLLFPYLGLLFTVWWMEGPLRFTYHN